MTQQIDYRSVNLPDDEQYDEWTYAQRRAYILSEIEDAGHPRLLNQSEIAREFNVDRSTISRDIDTLGEFVGETLGDRRQLTTGSVVQKCISELLANGEWRDAGELALKFDEWVARETDLAEMQEQLQAILSAAEAGDGESEATSDGAGDDGPTVELAFDG